MRCHACGRWELLSTDILLSGLDRSDGFAFGCFFGVARNRKQHPALSLVTLAPHRGLQRRRSFLRDAATECIHEVDNVLRERDHLAGYHDLDRLAKDGYVVARPTGLELVKYRITRRRRDAIQDVI